METLAYVGGSRWRIETEFETEKSDVGGRVPGLAGITTWPCACWADLLSLQQAWGEKDAPDHRPQVYRVVREMLPHGSGQPSCLA